MRLTPSASILPALALLLLPAALSAQTGASRPVGCRGTTSATSNITLARPNGDPVVIPSYPTIESVQPGSPAERAGFRTGDLVALQNGRDLVANPPTQPALAGDTVQFVVFRGAEQLTLTVVMGAWDPAEETPDVERVCRALPSSSSRD